MKGNRKLIGKVLVLALITSQLSMSVYAEETDNVLEVNETGINEIVADTESLNADKINTYYDSIEEEQRVIEEYYIKSTKLGFVVTDESDKNAIKVDNKENEFVFTNGVSYFSKSNDIFIPVIKIVVPLSDIVSANKTIDNLDIADDLKQELLDFNNELTLTEQSEDAKVTIYVPKNSLVRYQVNGRYYFEDIVDYTNITKDKRYTDSNLVTYAKKAESSAITIVGAVNPYVGALGTADTILGNLYDASTINKLSSGTDSYMHYYVCGDFTYRTIYDINGSRPSKIYSGMKAYIKYVKVDSYLYNSSTRTGDFKTKTKNIYKTYYTKNFTTTNIAKPTTGGTLKLELGSRKLDLGM